MNVSFEGIALCEVPGTNGHHFGYFADPRFSGDWNHDAQHGAGWYYPVRDGNLWFEDNPRSKYAPQPWTMGAMSWDIPIGWNEKRTPRLDPPAGMLPDNDVAQNTFITVDGTVTVSKFGHWVSRGTNDCRIVDGVVVHPGVNE